jgi:hypothetical protein
VFSNCSVDGRLQQATINFETDLTRRRVGGLIKTEQKYLLEISEEV